MKESERERASEKDVGSIYFFFFQVLHGNE